MRQAAFDKKCMETSSKIYKNNLEFVFHLENKIALSVV
jgi:hypothetical protein